MELRGLRNGRWVGAFVCVIAAGVLVTSGGSSMPPKVERTALRRQHDKARLHRLRDQTTSEFYNWSGWGVTGTSGSVTDVKGSWVVPIATCTSASDGKYAAFWIGIDGWNSDTVEQVGTDSDCESTAGASDTPTYYAWFEFYPQAGYYIGNPDNNFKGYVVKPLDVISAEVQFSSSSSSTSGHGPKGGSRATKSFTVTISDKNEGWSFTTSSAVPDAQQSSAEWIAEAPASSGCTTDSDEICPLANFGTMEYGSDYTAVSSTASATVSGKTGAIGTFGAAVQQAVMVSYPSGATTMAQPSALSSDGSSFTDSWLNAGP